MGAGALWSPDMPELRLGVPVEKGGLKTLESVGDRQLATPQPVRIGWTEGRIMSPRPRRCHLRQLRGRTVKRVRRAHVTLLGVDCSDVEWEEVCSLSTDLCVRHATMVAAALGHTGWVPRVAVVCLGASCQSERLPAPLGHDREVSAGSWFPQYRLARHTFGRGVRVRSNVFHELTHALFDLMSDFFPYPRVLGEGFACVMEHFFREAPRPGMSDSMDLLGAGRIAAGSFLPQVLFNIRDALAMDGQPLLQSVTHKDRQGYQRLALTGVWLVLWLSKLAEQLPACRRIMCVLRERHLTQPAEIYGFLQECTGMNADAMEQSLHVFARTLKLVRT